MKPATCKICRRKLENAESIAKGVGPECARKFAFMLCDAGLTLEALQIPESIAAQPLVARSLRLAESALLDRNRRSLEHFKAQAQRDAQRIEREQLAETAWEEELRLEYGRFIQAA
jgi:hypothetical protein